MKQLNGQIDTNDLQYVYKLRHEMPIFAIPCPKKNGDPRIKPNTSRFFFKDGTVTDVFHVKPIYYQTLNGDWRPLSEVTYGFGNHWAILKEDFASKIHPSFLRWWMKRMELIKGCISVPYWMPGLKGSLILNVVTTVFPDPDPETTTVDGFWGAGNVVWATAHDATTGTDGNDSGTLGYVITRLSGGSYDIYRQCQLFDTSSIPDTDVISDATHSLFDRGIANDDNGGSVHSVASNPATNTAYINTDFDNFTVHSDTSFGSKTIASWTASAYNDIAINATGQSNISKTGVTKFGCRMSTDMNETTGHGSAPTGLDGVNIRQADFADTSSDPKLAVTHAAAAAAVATSTLLLMGVG